VPWRRRGRRCKKNSISSVCGTVECAYGEMCIDDKCVRLLPDAAPPEDAHYIPPLDLAPLPDPPKCDAAKKCGTTCCMGADICLAGACVPPCANTRCGDNMAVCCAAGQICLDGVACAATCKADEALCGSKLDQCCAAGEVCLNETCVKPGGGCKDDFDCLEDDTYCDLTLEKCLPTPKATMCTLPASFDKIELLTEWHWAGVMFNGKLYENVLDTPAIGDVSGDGIPDVVVAPYAGNNPNDNILVALKGKPATPDGEVLWVLGGADAPVDEMVALANLDADPALEIVYQLRSGGIRIINGDGPTPTEIARRPDAVPNGRAHGAGHRRYEPGRHARHRPRLPGVERQEPGHGRDRPLRPGTLRVAHPAPLGGVGGRSRRRRLPRRHQRRHRLRPGHDRRGEDPVGPAPHAPRAAGGGRPRQRRQARGDRDPRPSDRGAGRRHRNGAGWAWAAPGPTGPSPSPGRTGGWAAPPRWPTSTTTACPRWRRLASATTRSTIPTASRRRRAWAASACRGPTPAPSCSGPR
jgi:hypothetical protein